MKDEILVDDALQDTYTNNYEIERNKPMPNRLHGTIQSDLVFELQLGYKEKYDIVSEVSLASNPSSTPDVCIFEKKKLDWRKVSAKETETPITTIEIVSPSQSLDFMAKKVWDIYFPLGVKSAWIIELPPFKRVNILTPNGEMKTFQSGKIIDSATGIEVELDKIYAGMV